MELNDDIDDIFNRLNEESNFDEPWEGAWEKMELKLDKGYKKYPVGLSTLKKFGIGVGILSSIIIGIILFNQTTHTNNQYKKLDSELAINKNELKKIENQKIELKLNEEDKKAEGVTVDSNKYLSNISKTDKLTAINTLNPNRSDDNLENVAQSNFNSKTLIKHNIKSKNKSNQNISKNQLLVNLKPELSKLNNKQKKNELNYREDLGKNIPITAIDPSELNKPLSNNLASNKNDLLTNETILKTRKNSISKSENILEDIFEKKSRIKDSVNDYHTNESGGVSRPKTENINGVITKSKIEQQNIEKAIERDIYSVNSLKKLNKVNFLTNFIFKNKPSDYYITPKIVEISEFNSKYIPTKGISLRLGYSPDISLIKGHSAEKIGNNFNALLEWRLNSKWAVSSGVIKSLKYYDAYPEEYNWPANWKKPPNPLLEINATCNMLDIPINIRYDLKSFRNGLFFIKSGLTSYVMLKEKYIYDYENNNDPLIKWKKWEGSTGNYKLGVINISTGFEFKYKKNIFVQIEPFAKIPVKEIGFGKVMLSTYGVFVSAKIPLINFK